MLGWQGGTEPAPLEYGNNAWRLGKYIEIHMLNIKWA